MFRVIARLVASIAAGSALACAYPPLDVGAIAWIAAIPLLLALRGQTSRVGLALGWLFGWCTFLAMTAWARTTLREFGSYTSAGAFGVHALMATVMGSYSGLFGAAYCRAMTSRSIGAALWVTPVLWVTTEWLRGWLFLGFPWGTLGSSQYRAHGVAQLAELLTVRGLSGLVALANAAIYVAIATPVGRHRRVALACLAVVPCVALWGSWRERVVSGWPTIGSVRVGIVQGSLPNEHKFVPQASDTILASFVTGSHNISSARPDLIVWPETALPVYYQDGGTARRAVDSVAQRAGVPLLFGTLGYREGTGEAVQHVNRAYLVDAHGRSTFYDKIELAPFGEYVPLQGLLRHVRPLGDLPGDLSQGSEATVFTLPEGRFGVVICYEGIFPSLARVVTERGANFIVNLADDGWYARTAAPEQIVAQLTFRAIENRVPILRVANTGISAIIGPTGRIEWRSEPYERASYVKTVAWPSAAPGSRSLIGDLFLTTCVAGSLVAVIGRRRREERDLRPRSTAG